MSDEATTSEPPAAAGDDGDDDCDRGDAGAAAEAGVWAVVEIMGHRTRAGRISEETVAGAPMLRIEHPTARGPDGGPLVELYASSALFSVRPSTRQAAEAIAAAWWRTEPPRELPAGDDLDDDEDLACDDLF